MNRFEKCEFYRDTPADSEIFDCQNSHDQL